MNVTWQTALEKIQADVKHVEATLARRCTSRVQVVDQVNRHTLGAGGKRLRPAFLILSAKATGYPVELDRTVELAACMEIVHMATLIHDDVIDHSDSRRGRPTAAAVFGNTAAILAGDVLLAKSMQILAEDGDLDIIRKVSAMVVEMAEGEAREVETRGDFDLSFEAHMEVLRMKTAAFVECCCEVGGLAARAPKLVTDALASYGHHLGLAFQLVDDVLDFRGDPATTGKPNATDFREGCATLPLIDLREHLTEEELDFTRNRFGAHPSDDEVHMICGWMETRGCYTRALAAAGRHSAMALGALDALPDGETKDLLVAIVDFVQQRER
ncbi:MAG: polyprenyl synthetase family protein [Chthonomonas sp.]|nr:polyprenyl synthetase family protein [Chthonomonas sp.]